VVNVTARVSLTKRKSLLQVNRGTDKGHSLINKREGGISQSFNEGFDLVPRMRTNGDVLHQQVRKDTNKRLFNIKYAKL
jgi:hypothetical protein